jgi:translation initiation factor 3 subunit E
VPLRAESESAIDKSESKTPTIIPFLDRHLAFPLLAHLAEANIFSVDEVQVAQYELANSTNTVKVDYTISLFEQLQVYPDSDQQVSV